MHDVVMQSSCHDIMMFQTHVIKYFFLLLKKMLWSFAQWNMQTVLRMEPSRCHTSFKFCFMAFVLLILVSLNVFGQNNREVEGKLCSACVLTENLWGGDQSHTNYALKESLLYHPFYQKGGVIYERNIVLCWGTLKVATACCSKKSTLE